MLDKIKYCKHYDIIMDFKFDNDDILSKTLKNEYYDQIINLKESEKYIKDIIKFDKYLYYYVIDQDFYKYLQNDYKDKENEQTYIDDILNYLIEKYELFQDFTVGTIRSGKWF